ncbi:hypothetical protein G6F57_023100 [Rhizopus arrhizus]|nr:hypothetical protein G6F57_023100 [Rhizopus arrhizus]
MVIEPECAYLAALRRPTDDLREMDRKLTGYEEADASGAIAHHHDYGFHPNPGNARAPQSTSTVTSTA